MKVAGGQAEDGIVIGNTFDKYGSRNPIVRWMMRNFDASLQSFVHLANPKSIHEVGCGEGFWVMHWADQGYVVKGTDFSAQVINMAQQNAELRGLGNKLFEVRSIYEVDPRLDAADLVVCCEVLEHVDDPERALKALQAIVARELIISVPREPLWRVLNLARGKYLTALGNTPGHINHWSSSDIIRLVSCFLTWFQLLAQLRGRCCAAVQSVKAVNQ